MWTQTLLFLCVSRFLVLMVNFFVTSLFSFFIRAGCTLILWVYNYIPHILGISACLFCKIDISKGNLWLLILFGLENPTQMTTMFPSSFWFAPSPWLQRLFSLPFLFWSIPSFEFHWFPIYFFHFFPFFTSHLGNRFLIFFPFPWFFMFFLPWPREFKSAKTFLEFFEPIVYSRKVENVQIPIKRVCAKI